MTILRVTRREFGAALGSAAAWSVAARGQQPAMPVVGYLSGDTQDRDARSRRAFLQGLGETGYIEGKNVAVEYRWAGGQYDQLPALAADLVHRRVDVIATIGGTPPTLAAKAATSTIPIAFGVGPDPVELGLVASLNRPGGNMTGVTVISVDVTPKRVELLHELGPQSPVIALLVNPTNRITEAEARLAYDATHSLGLELHILSANNVSGIDAAFKTLGELRVRGLVVSPDLFLAARSEQIIALAAQRKLPAIYAWRGYAIAGGLISYGSNILDAYRLVGVYSGNILKGAKPAELPVQRPTKMELVVNLKTAKALGLEIPPNLLARADEVIE
jgi:putative tryptophan/tyrosine transport system substrate-binding protein